MKRAFISAIVLAVIFTGCSGDIHLYDLQTGAKSAFKYHYKANGSRGTMNGSLADGESFIGEYSLVTNAVVGWGSIYGAGGTASGTAIATGGTRYGAAVLTGSKQTVLECEFTVGGLSAHGTGTCKTNRGDTFRMMF